MKTFSQTHFFRDQNKYNFNSEDYIPTKNKAAYSHIILLIKRCVFTCIMAIYNKKDSVNTCMHV